MTLGIDGFDSFFRALHSDQSPFAWQDRLLRYLVAEGRWPDQITAPTGAGKTAVIDVHVFAVALMAAGAAPRLPRRLSLVVDRRALVDSQYEYAQQIDGLLGAADGSADGVLAAVARLLRGLRSDRMAGDGPLTVAMVRGAAAPSMRWRDDPTACAVICATPDMWGSRLLFRGYGSSRHARPREAGLLAYDSVLVVDEAHLARQLVFTARRIAALEATASAPLPAPSLQVVETSATVADGRDDGAAGVDRRSSVTVEAGDLESPEGSDVELARRLQTPKPVVLLDDPDWPATDMTRMRIASRIAAAARRLHDAHGPTVACVANTVAMALRVAADLTADGHTVEVLVGRMRPYDVARLRERRPGLLSIRGDRSVDFVVATQTVEVGIDADFRAMVTELAAGSAIAQRAGRVNRVGQWSTTEIDVVVPAAGDRVARDPLPYRAAEAEEALAWLRRRSGVPEGLAPWSLIADPPPAQTLSRTVLQRPEIWDAWLWARTSDDLVAEPELDLWLADDLGADTDLAFVVRDGLPEDPADAVPLIRATRPRPKEAFPVSVGLARSLLGQEGTPACFLVRDDVELLTDPDFLRPGDTVVVPSSLACFEHGVVTESGKETASDVLEEALAGRDRFLLRIGPRMPIDVVLGGDVASSLVSELAAVCDAIPKDGRDRRAAMADAIGRVVQEHDGGRSRPELGPLREAQRRLQGRILDTEIELGPRLAGRVPAWLVIADVRRSNGDEEIGQIWVGQEVEVPLATHARDVADRSAEIARRVALGDEVASLLRAAGQHHDDGKRDARFQRRLSADPTTAPDQDAVLLAKSGKRSPAAARAAEALCGLPPGWRHEQLSAASAWDALAGDAPETRALIARLAGTSHGRGRSGFAHMARHFVDTELGVGAACRELYDDGGWDELIERTHRRHGVWGCAYLEALLRAADGQVSGEAR